MVFLIRTIKEKKMKKNFLMVASLLIAAMLLVVSCSQEVAPKNELVEAKLVANFGRDLAVEGDTSAENLSLEYKMTRNWNNPNPTDSLYENIVGEKEWTSLPDSGFVGWVTPGLWTIEVRAIASGATSEVFYGKVDAYYSQSQKTAVVYLEPENASKNNKIEITVSMQDIKVGEGENQKSYKLQYEILPGSGTGNAIVSKTDMSSFAKTGFTNVTEYKANKTGLDSGFYTVVVYVLDEKDKYKLSKWMKGCLNEYLRYASRIVDLEYYYFEYEDNKRSQREMIDLLIDRVWNF